MRNPGDTGSSVLGNWYCPGCGSSTYPLHTAFCRRVAAGLPNPPYYTPPTTAPLFCCINCGFVGATKWVNGAGPYCGTCANRASGSAPRKEEADA